MSSKISLKCSCESINEKKILAQIEMNKKKPAKKKSGFQKRLEEMAKQQQVKKK